MSTTIIGKFKLESSKELIDSILELPESPVLLKSQALSSKSMSSYTGLRQDKTRGFYKQSEKGLFRKPIEKKDSPKEYKLMDAEENIEESLDFLAEFSEEPCLCKSIETESLLPEYLSQSKQNDIEEILKEKWRYLVMQFGGIFLTELRPEKIFLGNKTLADNLITYNGKRYSLDMELLSNYLKINQNGLLQIHFSDIIFNPKYIFLI
jgi:hypothetical protein